MFTLMGALLEKHARAGQPVEGKAGASSSRPPRPRSGQGSAGGGFTITPTSPSLGSSAGRSASMSRPCAVGGGPGKPGGRGVSKRYCAEETVRGSRCIEPGPGHGRGRRRRRRWRFPPFCRSSASREPDGQGEASGDRGRDRGPEATAMTARFAAAFLLVAVLVLLFFVAVPVAARRVPLGHRRRGPGRVPHPWRRCRRPCPDRQPPRPAAHCGRPFVRPGVECWRGRPPVPLRRSARRGRGHRPLSRCSARGPLGSSETRAASSWARATRRALHGHGQGPSRRGPRRARRAPLDVACPGCVPATTMLRHAAVRQGLSCWWAWWTARGSNPRPPDCEPGALPAELAARRGTRILPERKGFGQTPIGFC